MKSRFLNHVLTQAALLTAAIICLPCGPTRGAIILMDDMSAPSYVSFYFNSASPPSFNPNDASSATFTQEATGGNPDGHLLIEHRHDVLDANGDLAVSLQSFFVEQSTPYNPSTLGAFIDISFSLDVKIQDPTTAWTLFYGVDSNGSGNGAGFTAIDPNNLDWQTITVMGLTNVDFSVADFAGNQDLKFVFGFQTAGSYSGAPETFGLLVDNFQVTVTPVPEPSSALLLVCASTCFLVRHGSRAWRESPAS